MHPFSFQRTRFEVIWNIWWGYSSCMQANVTLLQIFSLGNKYSKINNFGEDHRYIHLSHFLLSVLSPLRSLKEKCSSKLLYSTLLYCGEVIQVQSVGKFDGRGWVSVPFLLHLG